MEVQVSCVFYDRTTGSFDLSGQREFAHNKINIERKVKKGEGEINWKESRALKGSGF